MSKEITHTFDAEKDQHVISGSPENLKSLGEGLLLKAKLKDHLFCTMIGIADYPIRIEVDEHNN